MANERKDSQRHVLPMEDDAATPPVPIHNRGGMGRVSNINQRSINEGPEQAEQRLEKMRGAVRTLLECIGEDPDREGLRTTPSRYAKALLFLTEGYHYNVAEVMNSALFHEEHRGMVIVKDIEIHSLCEHHLVPFIGKVTLCAHSKTSVDIPPLLARS